MGNIGPFMGTRMVRFLAPTFYARKQQISMRYFDRSFRFDFYDFFGQDTGVQNLQVSVVFTQKMGHFCVYAREPPKMPPKITLLKKP